MNFLVKLFASTFLATVLLACGLAGDQPSRYDSPFRTTGLALTSDALAETDISYMKFTVTPVACSPATPVSGPSETRIIDYEDMYIPGGISKFEDKPYDSESSHMFADAYFVLDAGCYDVETTPMRNMSDPSRDCRSAHKNDVKVRDGKTTEILLVNQCRGAKRGGLDVAGSINHPPEIEDLEFLDSKFIAACLPKTRVCLTATDPDSDPLTFEFESASNAPNAGTITQTGAPSFDAQTGEWRTCATIETGPKGTYGFIARVFDLDGNGTRIETLLKQQDPRDAHESRDTLTFPLYAGVDCSPPETDTGMPDTGFPDTEMPDSGDDTGTPDTGTPDSGFPDTTFPDVPDGGDEFSCTRTRGYWSRHFDGASSPGRNIDWPFPEDESNLICGQTWLSAVNSSSSGGNPWPQLAAQWIAAKLNLASGTPMPSSVFSALNQAELLLGNNCSSIPLADQGFAIQLKDTLDDYNNGVTGPGKCP